MAPPATPAASLSAAESRVRKEQIELLFSHGTSVLLGNLLAVLACAFMLWDNFKPQQLLTWLLFMMLWTGLRMLMVRAHNGRLHERLSVNTWGWLFIGGAGISGLCWGVLPWLLHSPEPLTLAAIGVVLAGLTGAAAPALGTLFITYVIYTSLALLPFALCCLTQANELSFDMGVVAIGYFLCTLLFASVNNRFTLASIRLRFENLELLRQLQVQTEVAEHARQCAETASTSKTRFLAAASHDMRQPLQSITLLADALQAEALNDKAQRLLSSMREASASMGELMDELMDYSRIDAGSMQAEFRPFDVAQVLVRIEAEFAPLARTLGLRLSVRTRHLRVLSDARMIERILRNLVSNALKYTHRGGVIVACRVRRKVVRLEVWDSGVGIPQDKQGDVFREFYQLDNPERDRRKGIGLGLAIVDGLTRLLGQRLQLRSIEGRGSVFAIELPLDTSEVARELHPLRAAPLPHNLSSVLVIDNEPVIQQAMAALLAAWGCQVTAVESLGDALLQLKSAPDAILADYRLLEGETGIDAIEGVRRHFGRQIPAAVITGDTDPHRLAEARASGFPLLQKPTPSAHLREVLSTLLSQPPLNV
jgi:two-component system, sensor histidine kinase